MTALVMIIANNVLTSNDKIVMIDPIKLFKLFFHPFVFKTDKNKMHQL